MFTSSEKTSKSAVNVHARNDSGTFFRAAHESGLEKDETQQGFFSPAAVQARLKVSMPGDPYEQEADAVAEQVVNTPDTAAASPATGAEDVLARQAEEVPEREEEEETSSAVLAMAARMEEDSSGEEEEEALQPRVLQFPPTETRTGLQRRPDASSKNTLEIPAALQRRSLGLHASDVLQRSGRGPPRADKTFEQRLHSSSGGGNPLPESTREYMETRFGADFSGVRVHTDARAQEMNRDIHAHAFTHGSDIYFNSGRYDPDSSGGKTLLAHELTHTIQQGASPAQHDAAAVPVQRRVQRRTPMQPAAGSSAAGSSAAGSSAAGSSAAGSSAARSSAARSSAAGSSAARSSAVQDTLQRSASPPQLDHAVTLAQEEEGKVVANDVGPDGYRVGWERLIEYFETSFGKDKIVDAPSGVQGTVWRGHIKKKSEVQGQVPNQKDPNVTELRDAMPSWCGIFVFWSLNKSGVPMPKWTLGESMIPPEAAYPPGYMPKAGDIAYRKRRSHFGIVVRTEGGRIVSVNGNTAGSDNLGGEVQEQTHTPDQWDGFFNPLAVMEGQLRAPDKGDAETEPRSLRELRQEKFGAQRKEDDEAERDAPAEEAETVETSPRLFIDDSGCLQCSEEKQDEEEEELQRDALSPTEEVVAVAEDEEEDVQPMRIQRSALASRIRRVLPSRTSRLQASWFGDAWDTVSGVVSEAAA
ncbi:MAG: DUF4157 domain-containing protein, partial [Bacteroidota bacterium]|nr:DUF4157 domain-containing protein [Bacteroidota bacterium]